MKNHLSIFSKLFLATIILFGSQWTFGQAYSEILQYSMTQADGSARMVGAGGGLSALGADFGTITQNPAGLARFRRSEFNITIGLDNNATEATFGATTNKESKLFMQLPSLGFVMTSRPENIKWKTMNFSVGYNRQISYNRHYFYEGDAKGSIVQYFAGQANGVDLNGLDDYESGLAYDVSAIYDDDNNQVYETDFDGVDQSFYHSQDVIESGSMGELTIALAGNYEDKLSVGFSAGVPIIGLTREKVYQEADQDSSILYFDNLEFSESLTTSGTGFNLKFGMMYQINSILHTGFALHSPTWISLSDNYSNSMKYHFTDADGPHPNSKTPDENGVFDYKVKTPWRAIGSLGAIIGHSGFISGDVELVDYSTGTFNLTKELSTQETKDLEKKLNSQITKAFKPAVNVRLGGEYAKDALRLRAGIGLYGSAIDGDDSIKKVYSAGVGFREDGFFVDLAYRYSQGKEGYLPFDSGYMTPSGTVLNNKKSTISLTLGMKF